MNDKSPTIDPAKNMRGIDNAEIQRLLFSIKPEDGEMPVFEPVEELPGFSDLDMQPMPVPTDPMIREIQEVCKAGDSDRLLAVLQRYLQTDSPQDLQVCLLEAVESGREDLVQILLSTGVPVSLSALKDAIAKESIPLLSLFLKHGWNINEEEAWCLPPLLSFAISIGASESLIAWFLSHGADPNMICQMDITPLSIAVAEARFSIIEQLFTHCPATTVFRGQLLHWAAARSGSEDCEAILRLVLDRCQTDINSVMYEDHRFSYEVRKVVGLGTPIHEAARTGRLSTACTLIETGADISLRDSRGNTALEVAEREGNLAVADELREQAERRNQLAQEGG